MLYEESSKLETNADRLLQQFRTLKVWHQGIQRAPHKPLLLLRSLGRVQAGRDRLTPFSENAPALERLLRKFGPQRLSVHPEYPFWRLQHDGAWELVGPIDDLHHRQSKNDSLWSELLPANIVGGFPANIHDKLATHLQVLRRLALEILNPHLHDGICSAVGLDLAGGRRKKKRDPAFRREVMAGWGHGCAFRGLTVQLDNVDIGLEAAHIQWVQAGGPETLDNGLACCAIHHLAFDRRALRIADDLHIIVSDQLHCHSEVEELFLALSGAPVRSPRSTLARPIRDYLRWRRKEVFRRRPCAPLQ